VWKVEQRDFVRMQCNVPCYHCDECKHKHLVGNLMNCIELYRNLSTKWL